MDAIIDLIGEKQAAVYRELLLKHGCYKKRNRKSKVGKIEIDRTEICALEIFPYQQIDDTGCRGNGFNQYVHILCNEYYTAFFTMPRKDRMTVLDIPRNFEARRFLFNDDAPQFKLLTSLLGLCWVHAGRHFRKLNPIVPRFQEELRQFQDKFWKYYGQLKKYQEEPTGDEAELLEKEFDRL